ncbi:hypothetical protein [Microlunatus sp. Y2014]|uniref:hypothetical protein n=1 Tax=Microlunatus sp. Y2014 TaxID=3418488 RepID=UPI003DA77D5E
MIELVYVPIVAALLLAGFSGYHTWRQLPVSWLLLGGLAVLELLMIIQLIACAIGLANSDRAIDGVIFVGYLIGCVIVLPIATVWGLSDKSRWGTGVITIGLLTVTILCLRVMSIWVEGGAA